MKSLTLALVVICCSVYFADAQLVTGFVRPVLVGTVVRPLVRPLVRTFIRPVSSTLLLVGKREIGLNTSIILDEEDTKFLKESDSSVCIYTTSSSVFSCFGKNETFDCPVVQKLAGLKDLKVKLTNLVLTPTEKTSVFSFLEKGKNFTLITPVGGKPVIVSLKNVDDFTEPGLLIQDKECWSLILDFVKQFHTVGLRLNLVL